MSDQQLEKKSSLDSAVWNDFECPERSNSDRFYSPYDVAILQRLQFLTQRVEYLENKLENSLSDKREDLSFGLSVNHQNNVPNVDIKVLSGHNEAPLEGENVMAGWEDAIVERNTSFLIIPVGEDKDLQTNDPELLKQTLDLSIKPSFGSRPALGCSDSYREIIDTNSFKERPPADEQSTKTNSISLQIRPPPVKTYVKSTNQSSSSGLDKDRSERPKEFAAERVFPHSYSEMQHAVHTPEDQETQCMTNKMSKLTTSHQNDNNNNDLSYGYTISLSRSPRKDNYREKNQSLSHNLPPVDKQNGQDDTAIDFANTFGNQETQMVNPSHTIYNNTGQAKSQIPPQNVRYEDVEICEVVQYEDKCDQFDRTVDLKIERRISNGNCVYSQTNRRESISKQSKNASNSFVYQAEANSFKENQVERNGECFDSGVHDSSFHSHDKIASGNDVNVSRKMQIQDSSSRAWRTENCKGIDSDESLILEDNGRPRKGLHENNSYFNTKHFNNADFCEHNNATIQPDQKHHTTNKPSIKKVRVRSVEIPYASSDDDAFSVSSASELSAQSLNRYQRPQRRKPKSKAPKSHDIEKQLEDLINPTEIGNAREQREASSRPLLIAAMSPTESGYVGSSPSSPRDELKDSSFTSVSSPVRPGSPCSSITSTATPIQVERSVPSNRIPHRSVASSTSSEYSHSKAIHDGDSLPSLPIGLNDVLPGPTRLSLSDYSPTQVRLSEFLLANSEELSVDSTASSVVTSDLSDSFLDCQDEFCQCQTGISTEDDFREELKSISRYVIEAGEKSGSKKKRGSLKKYFLDDEQGEMDIFGAKLQKGEHRAVPLLVKVILRLRKHFFGGLEGPHSLKSLTPIQNKQFFPDKTSPREKKISFSPSAMLLSAVGESSPSEIRKVMEKEGLDVNVLSPSGKSLLHKAAASGNLESIHTLIQYGADVNLPDQDGFVPVNAALRKCHYKCAIFLIECGTDMSSYTRTRIQELAEINNMARTYKKTILNTAL